MAKKFFYKGLDGETLKKLSFEDLLKLLPSKARRTLKRMGYQLKTFLVNYRKHRASNSGKPYRTTVREMVVIPEMLGDRIQVYNGNSWVDVTVTEEMIGHRLGEYSITMKNVRHSGPGVGATRGSKAVELK